MSSLFFTLNLWGKQMRERERDQESDTEGKRENLAQDRVVKLDFKTLA